MTRAISPRQHYYIGRRSPYTSDYGRRGGLSGFSRRSSAPLRSTSRQHDMHWPLASARFLARGIMCPPPPTAAAISPPTAEAWLFTAAPMPLQHSASARGTAATDDAAPELTLPTLGVGGRAHASLEAARRQMQRVARAFRRLARRFSLDARQKHGVLARSQDSQHVSAMLAAQACCRYARRVSFRAALSSPEAHWRLIAGAMTKTPARVPHAVDDGRMATLFNRR